MTRYVKRFGQLGDAKPVLALVDGDEHTRRAIRKAGWYYVTSRDVAQDPVLRKAPTIDCREALALTDWIHEGRAEVRALNYRVERDSYRRSLPNGESIAVAGLQDATPEHDYVSYQGTGGQRGYDPSCSACWLNHGHSEGFHREALARAESAQQARRVQALLDARKETVR